jgi:hypothetical protein
MRSNQTPSGSNRRAFFFIQIRHAGFGWPLARTARNHSFRRSAASDGLPVFVAATHASCLVPRNFADIPPPHNFATKNTPKKQMVKWNPPSAMHPLTYGFFFSRSPKCPSKQHRIAQTHSRCIFFALHLFP